MSYTQALGGTNKSRQDIIEERKILQEVDNVSIERWRERG